MTTTTNNTTQKEMVANLNDFRTRNGKKALTNCKASKAQVMEWIKAERLEFMKSVAEKAPVAKPEPAPVAKPEAKLFTVNDLADKLNKNPKIVRRTLRKKDEVKALVVDTESKKTKWVFTEENFNKVVNLF
jgi:hypothetical protein